MSNKKLLPLATDNRQNDFWAQLAVNQIYDEFGDIVRVGPRTLLKFGRTDNADSGVATTVATYQDAVVNETFSTTNDIDSISSGDGGDTEEITVVGHTIASGVFTEVTQTVTLTGQTRAALGTPLARVNRAYTTSATALTGPIYIYVNGAITAGKPDTDADTKLIIAAARQQSQKAQTVIADTEYFLLTQLHAAIIRTQSVNMDIELQVRRVGESFRPVFEDTLRTTADPRFKEDFKPYIVIPKNSDVRVVATSNAANGIVFASLNGIYAEIQTT